MTYSESNTLTNDSDFRGRVKIACLKFASSIQVEATTTPAHNARLRWAQQTYLQPDQMAMQVAQPTVLDPVVQQDGAAVTDTALQGAVEAVVNSLF